MTSDKELLSLSKSYIVSYLDSLDKIVDSYEHRAKLSTFDSEDLQLLLFAKHDQELFRFFVNSYLKYLEYYEHI